MTRPNSDQCMKLNEENCELCQFIMSEQYVFVKYYDIIEEAFMTTDAVDQKRNCIRLKWEHHCVDDEQREKGKV